MRRTIAHTPSTTSGTIIAFILGCLITGLVQKAVIQWSIKGAGNMDIWFVNSFGRYNLLYGSIGTIMVVMALIYLNSLAILIGFELNVSIKSLKAISEQREQDEKMANERNG